MFRNEFFGEARIRNIPEMNYVFDSSELPELEEKLETNLIPRLQYVRESAEKQSRWFAVSEAFMVKYSDSRFRAVLPVPFFMDEVQTWL